MVFIAFLIIPVVINSVTPLVNYGSAVATYAARYRSEIAFVQAYPTVAITAQKYKTQLANAAKFAPELAVIKAHPALFAKLATYPSPAAIPRTCSPRPSQPRAVPAWHEQQHRGG